MTDSEETLTIMFADLVDSSRLYSERGDQAAQAIVLQGLELLQDIVTQYYGTVIKTIGDEVLAVFDSADAGVQAALFMLKVLKATPLSDEGDLLKVKVGLNQGPVLRKDGDVFGNTVNTAARIVAQAKPMQVLASKPTVDSFSQDLALGTRVVDHMNLKGIHDIIELHEVFSNDVEDVQNMTCVMEGEDESGELKHRYKLIFGDRELILDQDNATIRIGREADNHIAITGQAVSRYHARLDWEKGKCYLTDQSTNGTFIATAAGTLTAHREKVPLTEECSISLGVAFDRQPTQLLLLQPL